MCVPGGEASKRHDEGVIWKPTPEDLDFVSLLGRIPNLQVNYPELKLLGQWFWPKKDLEGRSRATG